MRILRQRKQDNVDRRMALEGVPAVMPGVSLDDMEDGNVRVTLTIKRGAGFFERMRPPETRRSYDLDDFGSFVIRHVDGKRSVLDVVNAFEKHFKLSRREVELSVVAFFKLLMQRNVLAVMMPERARGMSVAKTLVLAVAFVVGGAALAGGALAENPSEAVSTEAAADTMEQVRALVGGGESLLPGSQGNLALEKMVEERFQNSGFETGEIKFNAPIFEPGTLSLDCGEHGNFKLQAMHPSLMRPGNFPHSDFESRLVYLGTGETEDLARLKGVDLKGAIAVMDFNCGRKWLDLLRFDLDGVVFIGTGSYSHGESLEKVYNSEVAVPRFFIDGAEGVRLRELAMQNPGYPVKANDLPSRWRNGELRNLWALIPGSDEQLSEKVIVFTAAMDSNSIVPERAYGAQRAVNLHILLKLLEDLKANRPLYSVMLVAVNARSQRYAGERQLAWHLMVDQEEVEALRDEVAGEMRLARLHATEYGKLHLDPIAEEDKGDLHIMMEVMWELDHVQSLSRKQDYDQALADHGVKLEEALADGDAVSILEGVEFPELDEILDLSKISSDALKNAFDAAEKNLIKAYSGFFAKRGRDSAELEMEEKEDLAMIRALRELSFEGFMEKAERVKTAFDDERLFEKWRGTMDQSTGRRVYVKTHLQNEFKSLVNKTGQDLLIASSAKRSPMSEAERKELRAELEARRDNFRQVLVLFNKLDIGVGRSRTYYRQIAVNDVQRTTLREAKDKFVDKFTGWQTIYENALERDASCGAIREAMGRKKVALVLSLEMDAHTDRVGFSASSPREAGGWFAGFASICNNLVESLVSQGEFRNIYVDALSGAGDIGSGHFFNEKIVPMTPPRVSFLPNTGIWYYHSANQTPAFSMKSAFADEGRIFGPDDTIEQLNPETLHLIQGWTRQFIAELLQNEEILKPSSLKSLKKTGSLWSTLIRSYGMEEFTGQPTPTQPVSDCMIALYQFSRGARFVDPSIIDGNVVNCYMGITDVTANQIFYGIAEVRRLAPSVYKMDQDYREVLFTIDKGRVQSSKQITSTVTRSSRATIPVFECREFVLKDRRDPSLLSSRPISVNRIWPKVAKGQSDPEKYGVHGADCLSPAAVHSASGPIGIYLYRRRAELEQDRLMVITDDRRCLLNSTMENPRGEGFLVQDELGGDMLYQISLDMALLNKSRNEGMQGVVNQLLDEFLKRGDELNKAVSVKRSKHDHLGYLRMTFEALGNQIKAYSELRQMNGDMLKAVIVYLALMLPFCFFLQKLLFNFKRLEHELAGFSTMFFIMFVLFRFIHPAFRMAMSPEAIFIAFVLGAIGLFTTAVLRSRFNEEMAILFRGVGGIGEEVGYGTVTSTAMLIGVQNMRRRRIRTTLTTATIILVVFTMLAFSSVSRTAKPTLISKAPSAPYTGLLFHWPGGSPIDEDSYRTLQILFADTAEVKVRRLLESKATFRLERLDDVESFLSMKALIGIPQEDSALRDSMALVEGEQFSSPHAEEIILSVAAADALGVIRADVGKVRVRLLGREWLIAGLVDDQRLRLARDLNPNLPIIPFDMGAQPPGGGEDGLDADIPNISDFVMSPSELAIIPEAIARQLGASPRTVSVVFPDNMDEGQFWTKLRRVLDVTPARFYVGSRAAFKLDEEDSVPVKPGVYYVGSSYRTAIGGFAKLIIPLIIAGSIILNTMLGTVYERKSEVAVFNAIGLNPTHIFMFFLAEAIVYSFIGAVGGYLIGQILTIVLKGAGLVSDVNINFSSLMVVYAILFTMALVILSTLYPGYVATRTAVPSGKRKWSMPKNDGQKMKLVFPFIYRPRLAYGVMYYLQYFFQPMSDQSLGDMVATLENISATEDEAGHPILSLRYLMALSPFDLGVTQRVTFVVKYDAVSVKSFRLHMEIDRVSGRDTNWVTTNKPFLERMRKYLIRWRNIDPTKQTWFVKNAVNMFDTGEPPLLEMGETLPEEKGETPYIETAELPSNDSAETPSAKTNED